ncbi:hypothetical protein BDIM_30230 [Brevundimonas diminuta ATCC 11568]|nr:hypothetical protein BDIM_30230 [Brevundimonas diminuta ATCC 11568]
MSDQIVPPSGTVSWTQEPALIWRTRMICKRASSVSEKLY